MNTASVKQTAVKATSNVVKFGAGGLGFGLGLYGMGKLQALTAYLPSFVPEILKKLSPGLAIMFLSYYASTKANDERLKSALLGVGFSGGADAIRRVIGSFFPGVKSVVPGLDGTQGAAAINVGDFQVPYYKENAFQGFSMQGMSMQGQGSYALNGAYALNGGSYSLMGRKRKGLRGASAYALN